MVNSINVVQFISVDVYEGSKFDIVLTYLGHTTPRNDIDVYLWPKLWNEGVTTLQFFD
jgi:hypothetical protein